MSSHVVSYKILKENGKICIGLLQHFLGALPEIGYEIANTYMLYLILKLVHDTATYYYHIFIVFKTRLDVWPLASLDKK